MLTEKRVQFAVDKYIRRYRTTNIEYFPYEDGPVDRYGQRDKTFLEAKSLVGRAIHDPTPEKITVIGQGEIYSIAFLFSKIHMKEKFPDALDGEWIQPSGRMRWRNRTYKIEKVAPSGQVGGTFSLLIVLASSLEGSRDL